MATPTWAKRWWLLWLGVFFLPVELFGAKNGKPGDTFSEFTWDAFGVKQARPYRRARQAVLGSFLLSLVSHLVLGTTVKPVAILAVPLAGIILYWAVFETGDRMGFLKKSWPAIKAVVFPIASTAASLAAAGTFGPKAAAAVAAVTTLIGLFTKAPQDHKGNSAVSFEQK